MERLIHFIGPVAILIGASLLLGGCQSPSQPASPTSGIVSKSSAPDLRTEAMDALYANHRTPKGFYSEPQSPVISSVYHLKNTDIPTDGTDGRHDLCTDNPSEAYGWIGEYMNGDPRFALLDSTETPVYSEMTFQSYGAPTVERHIRVFKCSYADRSAFDWNKPGTTLAKLNAPDGDGKALEFLSEYLWYFSPNNNSGNAVLSDKLQQVNGLWQFNMTEVYDQANWNGGCNTALIFNTTYQVDPVTGVLVVDRSLIDSFQWQHGANGNQLCTA